MYIVPTFRKMLNLDCKKYKFKEIYHDNLQLAVEIQGTYSTASCPHCGEKTSKRKDKGLQAQKQRIKHMNYGGNQVIELILFKRRFRCNTCSKSFHERFDFESQYGNYSRDFEKYVIWSFGFLSGNKIAELYQSSSTTIYRILERIEIGMLVERGLEIMSNLDEIYL
jgi:transposase